MEQKISRREQKKIQSRSAILRAAVTEFSRKGYQETSVADIMAEAALGIGTFYNYFTSKEEVLLQLLGGITDELSGILGELWAAERPVASILEEMTLRTAEVLSRNRFVLPLFLSAAGRAGMPEAASHESSPPAFKTLFGEIVRRGQASGEFRTDIPDGVVTEMFHSMFQAAAFSSLPISFEENIRLKLRLVLDGLMAQKKA